MADSALDSSVTTVEEAIARARQAAKWWEGLSFKERNKVLLAFKDQLLDRMDEIVETACGELGKPRFDVINEITQACDLIGFYAKRSEKFLRSRSVWPHLLVHKRVKITYRPLGVVGVVTPWNYPVVLVLSPVIQALVTGNSVVLKPSEFATKTAKLLHDIFTSFDLPEPVWQLLTGGPVTAVELASAKVDKIAFTGGVAGGKAILKAASARLTPVLLELGGNDAMMVAADADLDRAASAAVWGAFLNAGQSCIAVERCYVEWTVYDIFVEKVVERTKLLTLFGDEKLQPDNDHDVGPLVNEQQFKRMNEFVKEAISQGAKVEVGGPPGQPELRVYPPTVLTNVYKTSRLMREETFGPILPILAVDNIEEAVVLANDSPFGLSASLWTRDLKRARRLARKIHVGGIVINDCLLHFGITELPFGGVGESGIGRSGGREGLLEYCVIQTITEHRIGPRLEFHWFPYGGKHRVMSRLARLLFRRGWFQKLRRPKQLTGSTPESAKK